jgi:hypothetical protein
VGVIHVTSQTFDTTALRLKDGLMEGVGFNRLEVEQLFAHKVIWDLIKRWKVSNRTPEHAITLSRSLILIVLHRFRVKNHRGRG